MTLPQGPQTVSQQVAAGNLVAGGRAPWKRQAGLELPPWPGTHRAGWEDAGLGAEPSQSRQKGISFQRGRKTLVACSWPLAGTSLAASSPHNPIPSLLIGGIPWHHRRSERLARQSPVCFVGLDFICLTSLEMLKSWESCLW